MRFVGPIVAELAARGATPETSWSSVEVFPVAVVAAVVEMRLPLMRPLPVPPLDAVEVAALEILAERSLPLAAAVVASVPTAIDVLLLLLPCGLRVRRLVERLDTLGLSLRAPLGLRLPIVPSVPAVEVAVVVIVVAVVPLLPECRCGLRPP